MADLTHEEAMDVLEADAFVWRERLGDGRWRSHWRGVFERDGKMWLLSWHAGLTESQDGDDPFDDREVITVSEAEPYEVTETRWRKKAADV